jgi:hypothetical protein
MTQNSNPGPSWTYVLAHGAWWAPASNIEAPMMFVQHRAYAPDSRFDGVEWEIEIAWYDGRTRVDYAEFEDAVHAERPDLVTALKQLPSAASPDIVVGVLKGLEFVDATERERPDWLASI